LVCYSFLAHKEFRFVFPALSIALLHCGSSVHALWTAKFRRVDLLRWGIAVLYALQIVAAGYFGLAHQRAPIAVMEFLRETQSPPVTSVDFLTPCHATPWVSHIHRPLANMSFLDCSPPLHGESLPWLDEADRFKADPGGFATARFAEKPLPSHIVTFSTFVPQLAGLFASHGFAECARFTHDPLASTYMAVFCASQPAAAAAATSATSGHE